jgi:replicative DNA helicase
MVVMSLARRILAQASRASAAGIKHGNPGDEGWARIHEALPTLSRLPVWLTDQVISISDIERVVRQWTGPALGLLVVDYLQLVRTDPGIRDRRLQVEDVSQRLKTLAVAQRLPVLCLSSLSRPPKGTGTTAPTIHDLRESGELEHDADTVILLHRAWQAADCTVAVVKNRDGRVGEVHLQFIPESVAFDDQLDVLTFVDSLKGL